MTKRQRYWDYPSKTTIADIVGPPQTGAGETDRLRALLLVHGEGHEILGMSSRMHAVVWDRALNGAGPYQNPPRTGEALSESWLADRELLAMLDWTRTTAKPTRRVTGLGIVRVEPLIGSAFGSIAIELEAHRVPEATS